MPELAEVEWFRKQWNPGRGHDIVDLSLHRRNRVFRGVNTRELPRRLVGEKFLTSQARGKRVLFEFTDNNCLGIHLGMTGKIRIEPKNFRPSKHDHLVLYQRERTLVFTDSRQFGRVRFHHGDQRPDWWKIDVPEIISAAFNQKFVDQFLARHRKAPIKAVLLLQTGFSGIGNWMADEILWRARVLPATRAGALSKEQLGQLFRATRFVARESLRIIGENDAELPRGWLIHERWRSGGKCPRHGIVLCRETIGGRTTAWCPKCQRHPERSRGIPRQLA